MPNVTLSLPNIENTVTHAVVADLAEQVQKLLGLEYVNELVFVDSLGNAATPSSFHGAKNTPNDRYARYGGNSRLWIEATEETNIQGWTTMIIERDENYPFFIDEEVGVNIQPVPLPTDLTLKFKFRTPNRDEAVRWRDNLISRLARVMEGKQHSLTFSMNLSPATWNLLHEIYCLREEKAPYGQTFLEYVKEKSSPDLTLVAEASGEQTNLSFRRRLGRVNGKFKVSPLPDKPAYTTDGGVWECMVEYVVTYDKPIQCRVRYPIMVHNNFLPDKYIVSSNQDPNPYNHKRNLSLSQQALLNFEFNLNGYNCAQDAYIQIPPIDDFIPQVVTAGTATIILVLLQLGSSTDRKLFNLRDLGAIEMDHDILEFLQESEYSYLNKPFKSFFGINLYRDQDLIRPESLYVDENLNVMSSEDLDLRKSYRVRLNLVVDPCLLHHDAWDRLNGYPKALVKYVRAVNEAMRDNVDFTRYALDRPLQPWMLSKLWRLLNGMGSFPNAPFGNNFTSSNGGYDINGNYHSSGNGNGNGLHDPNRNGYEAASQSEDTSLIPPEAWYSLRKSGGVMRTVQLSGIIVKNRNS